MFNQTSLRWGDLRWVGRPDLRWGWKRSDQTSRQLPWLPSTKFTHPLLRPMSPWPQAMYCEAETKCQSLIN